MTVNYNVTGSTRKAMVNAVSEALGGWQIRYLVAPTFSYQVGDFEIDRKGSLIFDDRTDTKMVENVLEALAQAGFECEDARAAMGRTAEKTEPPMEQATETYAAPMEQADEDTINLSISLTRDGFTANALDNLDGLLESKGNLIKKAFGIEEASYTLTDDRITFAWMSGEITPAVAKTARPAPATALGHPCPSEASRAFADFIGKLCEMAKTQKRVTAKPKSYENEKYAFRCFLLRLGLIGNEYKTSRKILLQNLSGNSSWRDGKRKEVTTDEVSDAHGCASVGAGA